MDILLKGFSPLLLAVILSGCGGSSNSGGGNDDGGEPPTGTPGTERTEVLDATSGWVYFDLENGAVVDAPSADNWHLAFNRYNVKTNGGISGEGKVGSFVAATPEGFYDETGAPVSSAFLSENAASETLPLLFDEENWSKPASANGWKKDTVKSSLNPAYVVEVAPAGPPPSPMQFNYGWYRYYSGIEGYLNHSIAAIPENGVMLRSAEGNSYAAVRLTNISYADLENATSQTTWEFEFGIAPTSAGFATTATWELTPLSGQSYCYDFDLPGDVDCNTSTVWDLKFVMGDRGTPSLYTNSGSSGSGNGGALGGPFEYTWAELQDFESGLIDNEGNTLVSAAYLKDSLENAFAGGNAIGSAMFEYGLTGHLLLSNYRVFLITTDNSRAYGAEGVDTYAVQVVGYYGGASGTVPGHMNIRWIKTVE